MDRLGPSDVSFTFSAINIPTQRPRPNWLSYWILGVIFCEGLGKFLWVGTGLPSVLPAFLADIPRPIVVGGLLGAWQSVILFRWLKGGGDWWLPALIGPILGHFAGAHVHVPWASVGWLPGAAATGLATGFGQWIILRRSLRRSARWILICPCAKIAAGLFALVSVEQVGHLLASSTPGIRLLIARSVALVGLALMDGWLLGVVLRAMLEPGNYRGVKLRFPT